jgi:hypothetical protein
LLPGQFLSKPYDPLRLVLEAQLLTAHLYGQLVDVSLELPFLLVLRLKLLLDLLNLRLQLCGLPIQSVDLGSQLVFIGGANVQLVNRLLDVLETAALLFFKQPPFLFVPRLQLPAVAVHLVLVQLVELQLHQLELTLLLLPSELEFLLLAPRLCFVLLDERLLVLTQLASPEPVLLLLLGRVLSSCLR